MDVSSEFNFFLQLLALYFHDFVFLCEPAWFLCFLNKLGCGIVLAFAFEFGSLQIY